MSKKNAFMNNGRFALSRMIKLFSSTNEAACPGGARVRRVEVLRKCLTFPQVKDGQSFAVLKRLARCESSLIVTSL